MSRRRQGGEKCQVRSTEAFRRRRGGRSALPFSLFLLGRVNSERSCELKKSRQAAGRRTAKSPRVAVPFVNEQILRNAPTTTTGSFHQRRQLCTCNSNTTLHPPHSTRSQPISNTQYSPSSFLPPRDLNPSSPRTLLLSLVTSLHFRPSSSTLVSPSTSLSNARSHARCSTTCVLRRGRMRWNVGS